MTSEELHWEGKWSLSGDAVSHSHPLRDCLGIGAGFVRRLVSPDFYSARIFTAGFRRGAWSFAHLEGRAGSVRELGGAGFGGFADWLAGLEGNGSGGCMAGRLVSPADAGVCFDVLFVRCDHIDLASAIDFRGGALRPLPAASDFCVMAKSVSGKRLADAMVIGAIAPLVR